MTGALINQFTLEILSTFSLDKPTRVSAPDNATVSPAFKGWVSPSGGYRVVELVKVDSRPGEFFHRGSVTKSLVGDTLTLTQEWAAWTQAEIDAFNTNNKESEASKFDLENVTRAAVLVLLDELNRHSTVIEQIIQAGANASSIASFRNAMGAIQAIPQRDAAQLRTAIRNKLGLS